MASSKSYLDFVLEQLSDLEEITYRAMMGEYIIYYRGKIVGGIYDDRLLVKPVKAAFSYIPQAVYELPYEGAKEMLLVEDVDHAVRGRCPIKTCLCSGGNVMSREAVVEAVEKLLNK